MSIDGIKDTRIPSKKSGVIDLLHRHNGSVTQLTLRMALWRVCEITSSAASCLRYLRPRLRAWKFLGSPRRHRLFSDESNREAFQG